jgi:hypothetical protein
MDRRWQHVLSAVVLTVALGAHLAGCPKPGPAPVVGPPDAADAARPVSCETLCRHAEAVCPGSGSPCGPICNRVGATYARCVGVVVDCPGLNACDPLNAPQGAPKPRGK